MSNQKHPSGDGGDQHSEEHHKKESLADQLTGTLTDLTESISQTKRGTGGFGHTGYQEAIEE